MSRRNKRLAFRRMRALVRYIMAKLPDCDVNELALKTRCILFICDFEFYRWTGKPMLPKGFGWIKAADGPELVWRPKRNRYDTRTHRGHSERHGHDAGRPVN